MTRIRLALIIVGVLMLGPAAQGGLYNTAEPDEGPLDPNFLGKFRPTLINLQTIAASKVEVERPLRKRYLLQAELFPKVDQAKLSAEEKLNFSAVLVRRRLATDALQLLMPATRQHPDMFLLQSNLATAYHVNGDKNRARDTMKDCLDAWPKNWEELTDSQRAFLLGIGWNEGPYAFYREVETCYLKLLRLRSREPKEMDSSFETVDAIFGDPKLGEVKFVAESGEFEPGRISKAEKAKLPKNALDIVEQLLVWLPHDLRLQWLLGEVLNARGDVSGIKGARTIFDDLVYLDKVRAKDLMARRQVLNNWVEPELTTPPDDNDKNAAPAAVDWRGLAIAFVVGLFVAVFGHWQIREWRRRRLPKS